MNKIKNFFLNNYIKIILLTLCYLAYNEYYNILLYLFLLYVISFGGIGIFAAFRAYQLKDLKTVLTRSLLLKLFYLLIIIGFVVKSIPSVLDSLTILFYAENKEKMINAIAGDNSKINVDPVYGTTWSSLNDNNNGVKFIYTLPYSSTVSDTIFTNKTKEETINVLKEIFSDKQISKLQDYGIYFKFQYYNQNDYLVKEINIDPNKDF
tara:strand:- start:75 stop:698 length:624 start_codon:yes stop_codon:yes gene_type:complete